MAIGDGADALLYAKTFPVRDITLEFGPEGRRVVMGATSRPGSYIPPAPDIIPDGALNKGDWVFGGSVWHLIFYNQTSSRPVYARCNYQRRYDQNAKYIWRAADGPVPMGPKCKICSGETKIAGGARKPLSTAIISDPVLRAQMERRIRSGVQKRFRFEIAPDATV